MAKTNWQDPKTSEMRSTHISGLQEAVGKIEESIGLSSIAETGIPLTEVFISNDDRCRIYQAPAGKRNWLLSPAPVIKKNGSIITQDFEIDYGGGAVIFTTPISESDVLTADATYATKITGKQLSTEDYTTTEKNKLAGIDTGANKTLINNTLTSTSTTQALSAAQGKTLKDAQDSHTADNTAHGEIASVYRSDKDANGVFVTLEYKRTDGTLFKKSVLSGGVSPKYTTRTVTYYAANGTTIMITKVYTLTYTGDDLTSEVTSQ